MPFFLATSSRTLCEATSAGSASPALSKLIWIYLDLLLRKTLQVDTGPRHSNLPGIDASQISHAVFFTSEDC